MVASSVIFIGALAMPIDPEPQPSVAYAEKLMTFQEFSQLIRNDDLPTSFASGSTCQLTRSDESVMLLLQYAFCEKDAFT